MKKITKVLLSVSLLAAPLMACGNAKAEPCGARCMSTGPTEPTEPTEPTNPITPLK